MSEMDAETISALIRSSRSLGVSQETFERWRKAGLINPKPLAGLRRMTTEEIRAIPHSSPGPYADIVSRIAKSLENK